MGNIASGLIPKNFEESCKGVGAGKAYKFKCKTSWDSCKNDDIEKEYNGKKIKCGVIYQEGNPFHPHLEKIILVENDNCGGFCGTLQKIPIIGNLLVSICDTIKWVIRIGGLVIGILMLFITAFLIYKKYYIIGGISGMGGVFFIVMAVLAMIL